MSQQWLGEASRPTPAKAKDFIQVCDDLQENIVSGLASTGLDHSGQNTVDSGSFSAGPSHALLWVKLAP